MKKIISFILILCLVLSCGVLFSSCKKDENGENTVETMTSTTTLKSEETQAGAETVYVEVEGESNDDVKDSKETETQTIYVDVTDGEGNVKTSKVEYSVKGGSDPYVEDIF